MSSTTISRTVWILSIVSLFTDMASEMLYPIMPIYLQQIGFSVLLIGILEGFAEASAGLSKGYFGKRSDISNRRVPFVQLGYAISAISKPLLALFMNPLWVFFTRTFDRLGKGIRTGARDALLSDESSLHNRGRVFGLHRSMDTIGAVLGPLLALCYLHFYPESYRTLFFLALIPGLMAIAATRLLTEPRRMVTIKSDRTPFFSFLKYWKESPSEYRKLLIGLLAFTLINSSDLFLLLKLKEAGSSDSLTIGVYIFYNLIYALFSFPLGIFADRIGLKRMFVIGLFVFASVYLLLSEATGATMILFCFFLYGIYAASTEGISKAWISSISDKKDTATALGTYSALQSVCGLLASTFTGLIWYSFGSSIAFLSIGSITFVIILYLVFNVTEVGNLSVQE